jgi:hypothetical protein
VALRHVATGHVSITVTTTAVTRDARVRIRRTTTVASITAIG